MKQLAMFSMVFLLCGASALAQTSFGAAVASTVQMGPAGKSARDAEPAHTIAPGCPVSLRVQHGSGGSMLAVDKGRPKGLGQLAHVTLASRLPGKQIQSARITAYGLSAKGRIAQASANEKFDVVKNLDVTFAQEEGTTAAADLWVPGMTAVRLLHLDSLTYADGSTWKVEAGGSCSVVPDGLMRIAQR